MLREINLEFSEVTARYPEESLSEAGQKFRKEFPGCALHVYFHTGGTVRGISALCNSEDAEMLFRLKW